MMTAAALRAGGSAQQALRRRDPHHLHAVRTCDRCDRSSLHADARACDHSDCPLRSPSAALESVTL